MGMSVTPRLLSASMTAFMTTGSAPTVPASPAPLTPSGLVVVGVGRVSILIPARDEAASIGATIDDLIDAVVHEPLEF